MQRATSPSDVTGIEQTPPGDRESLLVDGRVSSGWSSAFVGSLALMFGPSALIAAVFGVFAAGLERQTGWSHSAVTYGSTIISIITIITSPLQGYLVDRFGGRRVVLCFIPLFGVCLLGLNLATISISAFYIACGCLALSGLGLWPLSYIKVTAGWFRRHLGLAVGVVNTGIGIAAAMFPLVLGFGYRTIGWSATYAVLGAIVLVLIWPAVYRWLRESGATASRGDVAPAALEPFECRSFREATRTRVFWLGLIIFFSLGIFNAALLVHGIAIMKSVGIAPDAALKIQAFVGVCAIVARLGTGWLIDQVSVRFVGVAMFLCAVTSFGIWAGGFTEFAVLAACLSGLVFGAEFDVLGVMIRRHLGNRVFGRVYGIQFGGFHFGGAVGSAGLAYILSRSGGFQVGLQAIVAMCLVCLILFMAIGKDPASRSTA